MDSIVILYDMASKYQEHMEGYDKKGLFSGYAITYLPRKIKAQYFRAQENALMLTQPDGSRKWEFRAKPISYDHITSNSKDEAPIDERKFRHPGEFTAPPTVDVNYAESISKSNFDFEQSGRWRIDSDA